MKSLLIKNYIQKLREHFNSADLEIIEQALTLELIGMDIVKMPVQDSECHETQLLSIFLSAKRIEGCSEKTLKYYFQTIERAVSTIDKPVKLITTDDIREYIASYQNQNKISNVTVDNVRRILSSYFNWLEEENYIFKNPVKRIHKVKCEQVIKDVITDEQLTIIKDNCSNSRDLALVEMFASTGIRVGELVLLNKSDMNFNERSCIVLGKGNKQREVYFDAKTKVHLSEYLNNRKDDSPALFVSINDPYSRLTISGVESIVKRIGLKSGIKNVHPHKFRRTLATYAIDKGMPIEQVQKLLGHVKIDTTLHYAIVNQNNVKVSHRRYIS